MKRFWLTLFLLLASLLAGCARTAGQPEPRAIAGVMDLQGRSWQVRGPVALNGEWEFYWRQLLEPSDFAEPAAIRADRRWLQVPGAWNEYRENGRPLPGDGFATLRLTIRNPGSGVMALRLPAVATSYRLWVDSRPAAAVGVVAAEPSAARPLYRPQVVYVQPQGNTVELVLQIANYSHRQGGIRYAIEFGPAEAVSERHERRLSAALLLFGSLWALGLYHLVLALAGTRSRAALYFGLACLVTGLRSLLVGEIFLAGMAPWLPWEAMLKLEYLTMAVSLPSIALFLQALYPDEVARRITQVIVVVGALFALLIIVMPARIYSQGLLGYQVFLIAGTLYLLARLPVAVARRRPGALGTFLAALMLGITMVLDILYYAGLTRIGDLSSFGFLFFLFSQSLLNSAEYARTFAAAQRLSRELQELNRTLEEKISERTQALLLSERRAADAQSAMSVIAERQRIAREIHHAVGHALTTVTVLMEAARRLLHRDLGRAEEKLEVSQELVREGLAEVRRAVHTLAAPPWEGDLQLAMQRLIRQTTGHTGITVGCDIGPLEGVTTAQAEVLYHALQEGLTNGIRHGQSTRFGLSLSQDEREMVFTLTDNGQGEEKIAFGFGLTTLRDRVQVLNGTLTVTAAPGRGCSVRVNLPRSSEL